MMGKWILWLSIFFTNFDFCHFYLGNVSLKVDFGGMEFAFFVKKTKANSMPPKSTFKDTFPHIEMKKIQIAGMSGKSFQIKQCELKS